MHLLDQLVRQLPDGIYLKQRAPSRYKSDNLRLCAVQRAGLDADAQHRVVAVAREARAHRDQAGAVARGAAKGRDLKINEFTLNFLIKRAAPTEAKATAAPPWRHREGRTRQGGTRQGRRPRRRPRPRPRRPPARGSHEPRRPPPPQYPGHRQLAAAAEDPASCSAFWSSIIGAGFLLDWKDQWDTLRGRAGRGGQAQGAVQPEEGQGDQLRALRPAAERGRAVVRRAREAAAQSLRDRRAADRHQPGGPRAAACSSSSSGRRRRRRWRTSTPSCRSRSASPAPTTTWARSRATSRSCRAS